MKNLLAYTGILTFVIFSHVSRAQVSGTVNVPGTFPTLEDAVNALNSQGVGAGGATINILANQTCPVNGYQLGSATLNNSLSAANPLTINGNGNAITAYAGTRTGSLTSGVNDGMIILSGSDYVTFNNIVFNELVSNTTNTLAMEHAIGMYNRNSTVGDADGCKFINITNCTFNMSNSANVGAVITARQYVWNVASAVAWEGSSTVDIHSNITVDNNTFSEFYNGVHFRGASSRSGRSLVVTNNTFTNIGGGSSTAYGTYTLYCDSIVYNNNTSVGDVAQTTTSYHCFTSTSSGGQMEFLNNDITLQAGVTSGSSNGITSTSIGSDRRMMNNRVRFGSFPNITSGSMTGLSMTYTGGVNDFLQEMKDNVIMDENLPTSTGTVTLMTNGANNTGSGRNLETSGNVVSNITKGGSGTFTCISLGTASYHAAFNNTVSNVTVTNNTTSGSSFLRGIDGFGSPIFQEIHHNTVTGLSFSGTSSSSSSILMGIRSGTTGANVSNVYNNTVSDLSIGAGNLSGTLTGIDLSINQNNVYSNNIHNLNVANTSTVRGIGMSSGALINVYNNMISDLTAPSSNSNVAVSGIISTSTTSGAVINIIHNTIFPSSDGPITSSGTLFGAGGIVTANSANPTFNVYNNIVNITGTANGDAYISAAKMQLAGTNGTKPATFNASNNIYNAPYVFGQGLTLSSANNVYYITGGTNGTADPDFNTTCGLYKTFMGESGTFQENNLGSLPMNTFAPTGLSYAERNAITTDPFVSEDYSGASRPAFADVGALEFNGSALDATGPVITYNILPNSICTNSVRLFAEITDASGINTTSARPRLYFKRSTHNNVLPLNNSSISNGWKFVEASNATSPFIFDMDLSLLFGGPAVGGWQIEYFVVAQDNATTPNVGTNNATYPSGFCPSSVILTSAAFPVTNANTFEIINSPVSVTTLTSRDELCISGDITLSLGGDVATGAEYQWQSSPAGTNTWSDIPGANSISLELIGVDQSTDYRCVITCGGTPIAASPSAPVNVDVTSPDITNTQGGVSCTSPAVFNLTASATPGASIDWYENASGGAPIATGATFTTPSLTETTVYYVSASEGSSVEPAAKPTYTTTPNTSGNAWGLVFDVVNTPIVINSVEVYSVGTGGSMVVELRDNTGTLVTSVGPFTYPAGSTANPIPVTFNLNLPVDIGTGWRIQSASMTGALIRETSGNTYPYVSPSGNVAITSGFITNPGSATYYWFYNWQVTTGCSSERLPVTAAVVTTPPTCPADFSVCLSDPAFDLTGVTPEGGSYSGQGVVGTQFSPALAGPGTHPITYTICGLSCSFNITVSNPIPTISIVENSGSTPNDGQVCNGDMATLTASAGSAYFWSTDEITQSIMVDAPGTYFVTVTDDNGCQGSNSAAVMSEPAPAIVPTLVQPTTCISANGSVSLSIISQGTFTYNWSTGSTSNTITNLSVGDYIVTITNTSTSCEYIEVYSLIGPGGCTVCPTIVNVSSDPVASCEGGTVILSSSSLADMGNTYGVEFKLFNTMTMDPYTGGVSLGIVDNSQLISSGTEAQLVTTIPTSGNYVIYAILNPAFPDPACRPSANTNLMVSPLPTASVSITDVSGLMNNDGIICSGDAATLTATGGTSYVWSNGANTSSITVNVADTYIVTVTSAAGCQSVASATVTVTPLPTVSVAVTETSGNVSNDGNICAGSSATLTAIAAGTFIWSTGATTQSISVMAGGTYTVTVTNTNGCVNTASSTITVNPLPVADISPANPSVIEGDPITLTASGGGTYRWSTGSTTSSITVTPLMNTTYTVTVTSTDGCTAVASETVVVLPPPCYLVCSGEQNISLPPGACEYTLPNLVTITGRCDVYDMVQESGPVPGDRLGVGSHTIVYNLIRRSTGEIFDSCEFTINIEGFSNPVGSLACNDHVNVSIDENCLVTLSADMFLEGGPYACYWDYQINIWPFESQANAINNVPQNVGLELPFGTHIYEIVGSDGNKCWGTFTVEDKLPPVLDCNCVDDPVILPLTNVTGTTTFDSPKLQRSVIASSPNCNGTTTTANRQSPYAVIIPFSVSCPGFINFSINATLNTSFPFSVNSNNCYQYIYSDEPNPLDVCDNYVDAQTFTTNGSWTPTATDLNSIGGQFVPGVTYYYVFASYYIDNIMNYNITFTHQSGCDILSIQNPANAPECQFSCYDLEIVQRETVGMLYNIPGQNQNMSKLTTPPAVADCGNLNIRFNDRIVPADCGSTKLVRSWVYTDQAGNASRCEQTFSFNQIKISNLTPPAADVVFTCGLNSDPENVAAHFDVDSRPGNPSAANIGAFADDYAQTPGVTELNEGYPFAYFTYPQIGFDGAFHPQKVDLDVCNIYASYEDVSYPACGLGCGGNMKIVRKWTLLDWCTREVSEYIQVIKSIDEKAPTFEVKDITVGVEPWECLADWNVEEPWELFDNCAKPEELSWGVIPPSGYTVTGTVPNLVIRGLTKGDHEVIYWAQDCCGNYTERVAFVRVIDASAPVPVAKENIVISLTNSGTSGDGSAKLFAWQVDNSSYDACSDVHFEIRRTAGGDCGNIGTDGRHNNNSTFNHSPNDSPNQRWAHPEDTRGNNMIDNDGGEYVKFCCEDIPAGESFGLHEVELRVWDDGNMNAILGDNDIIEGMRDNYNTTWATIRVENKLPPQLVCPPDVTLTCDMEIMFADDWTDVSTVDLSMTGMPVAYDLCTNLVIEYRDQFSGNDVCNIGTVRRTFRVTKGTATVTCRQEIELIGVPSVFGVVFPQNNGTTEWDDCDLTLEDVRNTNDVRIKRPIVNYSACDIVGENIKIDTFLFEDGACKKWRVEYNYINWCTEETSGPWVHYYTYKDETAPVLTCNDQMFAANPNPQNPEGGCEGSVRLEASATDSLVCADESWVKWQMFMDGWNNGTVDRLGSSFVNKAWFGIWVSIPRLISGALNPAWVALQNQHPGVVLDDLVYATYIRPTAASGGGVSLPPFTMEAENISHKVTWKVTDGCGNVDQCESTVMVVDKKAPTPYCVSISTALMQGTPAMVELWAKDFDQGAFDNCTPQSKLYFTFDGVAPIFSRINEEHFYKAGANNTSVNATAAEYNNGRAYKWIPGMRSAGKVFTQAGTINLNVDVWDEAWNTDFCTVELSIREASNRPISGTVNSFTDVPVQNVFVTVDMDANEYPKAAVTNASGEYSMDIIDGQPFTLIATKDAGHLDGVSTLDLVLIQRHLLDIQRLTSPYQYIAADANNDGRLTASDLTDIRRLILGIDASFRNNDSWRFAIKNTPVVTDYPISFTEIADDEADFVGIKIGDVNGSALGQVNGNTIEPRTTQEVVLMNDNLDVKSGSIVEIPVKADQFTDVSGFQFTLNLRGAQLEGIKSGLLELNESHIARLDNNMVTMSYASQDNKTFTHSEILFTLVMRVNSDMNTSDMFAMSSDVTRAESYTGDYRVGQIRWSSTKSDLGGYSLMQNEPNPFKASTKVSFELPNADRATLTLTDVTGKVIWVREMDGRQGLNTLEIAREDINMSGVVFYTLTSGEFTSTKKMILVD